MTPSIEARKQMMRDALTLMLTAVGDHSFDEVYHDVRQGEIPLAPFDALPWTTWEELEGLAYVRPGHQIGVRRFTLTGAGWIAALKAAQMYADQTDRVLTLRRYLVDANKGRPPNGTHISVMEIVGGTGLARGWVTSAALSQLLKEWFRDDLMLLEPLHRLAFRIPPRFGAERLDFDPST